MDALIPGKCTQSGSILAQPYEVPGLREFSPKTTRLSNLVKTALGRKPGSCDQENHYRMPLSHMPIHKSFTRTHWNDKG